MHSLQKLRLVTLVLKSIEGDGGVVADHEVEEYSLVLKTLEVLAGYRYDVGVLESSADRELSVEGTGCGQFFPGQVGRHVHTRRFHGAGQSTVVNVHYGFTVLLAET